MSGTFSGLMPKSRLSLFLVDNCYTGFSRT
jgi:hypothetical protein